MVDFYVGLHNPSHARYFDRSMVSYAVLRRRQSMFEVDRWMLDSGAFSELLLYGKYRDEPEVYGRDVRIKWSRCGNLLAAVTQDYMCEEIMLAKTGLSVEDHQRLTIERYDRILQEVRGRAYILPVLQGYEPEEYLKHLGMYGKRITTGAWVGVGSVCKRNSNVGAIEKVLYTILEERPDIRLHGFGLKTTALQSELVRYCLYSCDSMAWSDAARKRARGPLFALRKELGRKVSPKEARQILSSRGQKLQDANGLDEAKQFYEQIRRILDA
jgi:hypothetical protein